MSTPRASSAFPPLMHDAMQRALDLGEFFIPCPGKISPAALRLQFYGLISALRAEGKTELGNSLGFYLSADPRGLWLRLKDLGDIGSRISEALKSPGENLPASSEDLSDAFDRIMQGEKP